MSSHQAMTPQDARTFAAGQRVSSIVLVRSALADRARPDCACQPYLDVFTFPRWRAQGRIVRRGEHGIPLPVVVERTYADTNETGAEIERTQRIPYRSYVFCRCQTDPLDESRP